jgi:hypothetical protein
LRLIGRQDPQLLAVLVDDADLADADLIVDAERSSYGVSPTLGQKTKNGAAEATPLVKTGLRSLE